MRVPTATLRAVGAVTVYYAVIAAIALIVGSIVPAAWSEGLARILASSAILALAALLVNWVLVRKRLSTWGKLGWPRRAVGVRGFVFGVVLGGVMAFGAVVLSIGPGDAQLSLTGERLGDYLMTAAPVGIVLLVASLAEELLFRGYPLSRLADAAGKVGASVGLAVVFALAHAFNPNLTALGLINIGLAALVLSGAFFTPGALPAAWGLHVGWNGGLSLGADAPVSGVRFDVPALEFFPGGPQWFTGGAFGPEGGLVATLVMALALVVLVRYAAAAARSEVPNS